MNYKKNCIDLKKGVCGTVNCATCYHRSFDSVENSHLFNTFLNDIHPSQVSKRSMKKYIFECNVCFHVFETSPDNFYNQMKECMFCHGFKLCGVEGCQYCFEKSFASHPKAIYWVQELNSKYKIYNISKNSTIKYWFNCDKCLHNFQISCHSIMADCWCQYCAGKMLCEDNNCKFCYEKSFAFSSKAKYWCLKKNEKLPRNYTISSSSKVWFNCRVCRHNFKLALNHATLGVWCPYCSSQTMCNLKKCQPCFNKSFASVCKSQHIDNNINSVDPRNIFKKSTKKLAFICNICNFKFTMSCCNVTIGQWCSACKRKTEKKLLDWLQNKYEIIKKYLIYQTKFKWCKNKLTGRNLPFDFAYKNLKIILEVDGIQHYKQVSNWDSPAEVQIKDRFKEKKAKKHGYRVYRLIQEDIWLDKTRGVRE